MEVEAFTKGNYTTFSKKQCEDPTRAQRQVMMTVACLEKKV
jgi:hypothetical protein